MYRYRDRYNIGTGTVATGTIGTGTVGTGTVGTFHQLLFTFAHHPSTFSTC